MVLILTFLAFSFMMGLGGLLATTLTQQLMGVDMNMLLNANEDYVYQLQDRQAVRWFNLIAHLVAFTGTSLLIAVLAQEGQGVGTYLGLNKGIGSRVLGWSLLAVILGLPAIQLVNWLNSLIELPGSLQLMEDSQNGLLAAVLQMEQPAELVLGLLVAAVVPALGEELLFRGILQRQFQLLVNHPHWGIWVTAAVFSAIHMQFAGFFPRMLLGAFLGYTFWWSGSLWLPIVVHFFFNGSQVLGAYLKPDLFATAEEFSFGWSAGILGLLSVGVLIFLLPALKKSTDSGA
ncbi:MAG: CPBP family intramembrane glutamic endopeptidase [Bacteroidota bacterium]